MCRRNRNRPHVPPGFISNFEKSMWAVVLAALLQANIGGM